MLSSRPTMEETNLPESPSMSSLMPVTVSVLLATVTCSPVSATRMETKVAVSPSPVSMPGTAS